MTASARRTLDLAMSESQWQATVIDLARTLGWLVYHTYDSRRSNPGFPDLVLVRDRVVYAELKTEHGKLTQQQGLWGAALLRAGQDVHTWRPSDWEQVQRVLTHRERLP